MVELMCNYQVEGDAQLYSLKWYRDNVEFFRYIPTGSLADVDSLANVDSPANCNVDCFANVDILANVYSLPYVDSLVNVDSLDNVDIHTYRCELYSTCRHRKKKLLANTKEVQSNLGSELQNCRSFINMKNCYF